MRCPIVPLACALLIAPYTAAQFQVWTVDDDGPADFAHLQTAIDTAADGDALLLRGGTYGVTTLNAKRLTFLAEDGEWIIVPPPLFAESYGLALKNQSAAQPVLILGARIAGGDNAYAIGIEDSDGLVWIQSSTIQGLGGAVALGSSLLARETTFDGLVVQSPLPFLGPYGGDAVTLEGSMFYGYGSILEGATGANAGCTIGFSCGNPGTGGSGVDMTSNSFAHLSGITAQGGHGESSFCPSLSWGDAGSGGDGIHIETGSEALAIASTFTPGIGGQNFDSCSDGTDGVEQSGAGLWTVSPEPRRSITITDLLRENESGTLTLDAPAGETILLGIGTEPTVFEDPQIEGPLILGNLISVLPLGTMPPGGSVEIGFSVGGLPTGIEFFTFYVQPVFVEPSGERWAGDPMAVVILDETH